MPTMTWTETDAINQIGAPVPFQVFDELQANINALNTASGTTTGSSTFNGSTGKAITFSAQADTSYLVLVTPIADPGGNLGEVWVVNDSLTQATVYCSGSATTSFRYKVVP